MLVRLLTAAIDAVVINAVFLLSFVLRYGLPLPQFNFRPYRESDIYLTAIYMVAFSAAGVFRPRFRSWWHLFSRVFCGMIAGTFACIAFVYVLRIRWAAFPSSIFVISSILGLLMIFAANGALLRLTGRIKKKVILVGADHRTEQIETGPLVDVRHLRNLEELAHHDDIDEIILCSQLHNDAQLNLLVYLLLKLKVNVVFSPVVYARLLSGNVMDENSLKFLATYLGSKSDCEEFFIRVLDVGLSTLAILLVMPLLVVLVTLIKITSPGPVIYSQSRIGKDGKLFTMYKFRTMIEGAENETGPVLACENDPRVTTVGRFLRRTRLDELPQLINVIRGDMSLVGPRPERPHFVRRHKALREIRLAVRPGLTGLAQIRSIYDLHPRHKVRYDYLYIQKRSLLLNIYIIFKTLPVVLSCRGC